MQYPNRPGVRALLALMFLLSAFCLDAQPRDGAAATPPGATTASKATLITEAKGFMEGYAVDLLAGNRAAVASRYDRTGVYEIRPSQKRFTPYAEVAARYEKDWSKPATFEWRDLSYEVLAPDKVLVTGLFAWGTSVSGSADVLSYVAVLRKQDGALRIHLEAEAWGDASPPWDIIAGAALLLVLATLLVSWLFRRLIGNRRPHGP